MSGQNPIILTKSDFLLYCQAPRHLWAKLNGKVEFQCSEFDQHMMEQGYEVEELAKEYLIRQLQTQHPQDQLLWQQTYSDGFFQCRCDALVHRTTGDLYDLFEIKSSTAVDKENIYDIGYQTLILQQHIKVDHLFLVHLNKDYRRCEDLDLSQFFLVEEVTDKVNALLDDLQILRDGSMEVFSTIDPLSLPSCLNPRECPCPQICHPNLPDCSIFDIPHLSSKKKKQLLEAGIIDARDIPDTFDLNEKQHQIVMGARTGAISIQRPALRKELEGLTFPLYFLDYETCISAIPLFEGYHPQQQVVFQYSLHRLDSTNQEAAHSGQICVQCGDPSLPLLHHLSEEIGGTGSIIVWNKAFEMTMNKEMAILHPEYAAFLENVNQRIYDLGDIVNKGFYLHPGFKGSWSIKKVLPVMVPDLSYDEMSIHKGDQASMAWWKMTFEQLSASDIEQICNNLSEYCKLDTLAMVEIFKRFLDLSNEEK